MKTFKNIILLSSILAINLTFFGCMNFVPYTMQPSYHEFKEMCELNKLPNNEEKYNKILSYFDLSLDTLDWEELNKKRFKLNEEYVEYIPNKVEYQVTVTRRKTSRYNVAVILFANEKGFSLQNLARIKIYGTWYTRRYHLGTRSWASYELEWKEDRLTCGEIYEWR